MASLHVIYYQLHHCFQQVKVSFHTYPLILMHDRTSRMLLLSLTCLNRPTDVTITQTIFAVCFTPGSFPHLGRSLHASPGVSSRYSSATSFQLTVFSHYRYNTMSKFEFFSKDPSQLEQAFSSLWGHLDLCPILDQFHLASISLSELSLLTSLRLGETLKSFAAMSPIYLFPLTKMLHQIECMALP